VTDRHRTKPVADVDSLRIGLETAVRQALDEGNLATCIGESGTIVLGVQMRLDQGRVFYIDSGLGFQRRML
jgi:hypothetical protein